MSIFTQQFQSQPLIDIIERHYVAVHPNSTGYKQITYDRQTGTLNFPGWFYFTLRGKGPNKIIGRFKNGNPKRILSPIQNIAQWCMRQGLPSTTNSPTLWSIVHKISYKGFPGDIKRVGDWTIPMRDELVREVSSQAKTILLNELSGKFGNLLKVK